LVKEPELFFRGVVGGFVVFESGRRNIEMGVLEHGERRKGFVEAGVGEAGRD
jgi:hypothetical protein